MLPIRDKRGMEPNGKKERRSECCHTLIIWRVYVKNEGEKKVALGRFLSLIKYIESSSHTKGKALC